MFSVMCNDSMVDFGNQIKTKSDAQFFMNIAAENDAHERIKKLPEEYEMVFDAKKDCIEIMTLSEYGTIDHTVYRIIQEQ